MKWVFGILGIAAIVFFAFLFTRDAALEEVVVVPPSEDIAAFRTYWSEYHTSTDSHALLLAISSEYENSPPYEQHLAAHIAGEILYDAEGVDAIAACTDLFGFGCYHGLISSAISEGGEDAVRQLDQMCIETLDGSLGTETCQHGVGHGVLEYVGYTNVDAALALCATTKDVLTELGCKSGVFMEYFNPRSDTDADSPDLTPQFDVDDPLSVCNDVPKEAMLTCMFEAHSWWQSVGGLSARGVGALCERASTYPNGEAIRSFCYLGHGNYIAPQFAFDVPKSVAHCDQMGTAYGRAHCRAGVFWRIHFEKGIPAAREACVGLPDADFNTCIETGSFACELEGTCEEIMSLRKGI